MLWFTITDLEMEKKSSAGAPRLRKRGKTGDRTSRTRGFSRKSRRSESQSDPAMAAYLSLVSMLPSKPKEDWPEMWFWAISDHEVMCSTMDRAMVLADFLESCGLENVSVCIYDNEDSEYYGWYSIYIR